MAQVSFSSVENSTTTQSTNNSGNNVGFFSLKNDGDEALVRFIHKSVNDFDIVSVHNVEIEGKWRKVNCLREVGQPVDACPFCKNEMGRLSQRVFVHLIQYTQDENGGIVAAPKVWERPISYARELKSFLDEYGPLTECVFKIKRSGAARSMTTTYSTMFQNPARYPENVFPKMENAFDDFKSVGRVVLNKSAEQMEYFLAHGEFPVKRVDVPEVKPANWGVPNVEIPSAPVAPTPVTPVGGIPMADSSFTGNPYFNTPSSWTQSKVQDVPQFTEATPKVEEKAPWEVPGAMQPPRRY